MNRGPLASGEPDGPQRSGDAARLDPPGLFADALPDLVLAPLAEAVAATATVAVRDAAGEVRVLRRALAWTDGTPERLPLGGDRRPGIRWIDWRIEGAGTVRSGRLAVVLGEPAGPGRDPFLFGVCAHPLADPANMERDFAAAAAAGAQVLRTSIRLEMVNPRPGVWDWSLADRVLQAIAAQGMEPQIILFGGTSDTVPAAAAAAYRSACAAGDPRAWRLVQRVAQADGPWRAYVRAVAQRYRGRVRLYEVWNEPDLASFFAGSSDDFIRMQRAAAAEIRAADPQAKVLSGGFATALPHPMRTLNPDIEARTLAEAWDAFDYHAHHEHGDFARFRLAVEGELARLRAHLGAERPLYFNETAITALDGGELAQAEALVAKLVYGRSRGAIGYSWYDLRDDGEDPANAEHHFGLLTRDFQPKAVYAAYSHLVRRLRGVRFAATLDLGPGRQAHLFAGGGRRVLVAWNEDPLLAGDLLALRVPGCTAPRHFDLMGGEVAVWADGGVVVVQPRRQPAYWELPGGDETPEVLAPLLAVAAEPAVAASATVRVRAANPWPRPIVLRLGAAGVPLALAAGGGGAADLALALPVGDPALACTLVEAAWRWHLPVPVERVQEVPPGRGLAGDPDVVLGEPHLVSFCRTDPALQPFDWRGPADCSARAWLACTEGELRLRVDVRDDVHHQDGDAERAWAGDGIQVALLARTGVWWEIGAARHNDGHLLRSVWIAPAGRQRSDPPFAARIEPIADGMRYDLTMPLAAMALTVDDLRDGIRFNLVVNDSDGGFRKCYLRLAPGLAEGGKAPHRYPLFRFPAAPAAGSPLRS